MIGGAYLCYEGTEKVFEALFPHQAHAHEEKIGAAGADPRAFEEEKVRGAIRTDFILSAEIMAIALATIPAESFAAQAAILAVVGIGITAMVYGTVALIVKADDAGVALAGFRPANGALRPLAPLVRGLGRALVLGMPILLKALSIVGTAAMIWVGGGIIVHGLEEYGFSWLAHAIHDAAAAAGHLVPAVAGAVEWAVSAAASGLLGLLLGAALIPIVEHVVAPIAKRFSRSAQAARP
jgi:predicted DNA repair protein MutK